MQSPHQFLDDAYLVLRVLDGDEAAFATLYDRHIDLAYRTALAILRIPEEARAVAQEAFISIAKARPRLDPSAKFTGYVYTITQRKAFTRWRQIKRLEQHEVPHVRADGSPSVLDDIADSSPLPEDAVIASDNSDAIRAAIASLPANQALVISLLVLEGSSIEEVAQRLGCSKGAVKQLRHRGLERLSEAM